MGFDGKPNILLGKTYKNISMYKFYWVKYINIRMKGRCSKNTYVLPVQITYTYITYI